MNDMSKGVSLSAVAGAGVNLRTITFKKLIDYLEQAWDLEATASVSDSEIQDPEAKQGKGKKGGGCAHQETGSSSNMGRGGKTIPLAVHTDFGAGVEVGQARLLEGNFGIMVFDHARHRLHHRERHAV